MKVPNLLKRELPIGKPLAPTINPYTQQPFVKRHNTPIEYVQKQVRLSARSMAMDGDEYKKMMKNTALQKIMEYIDENGYLGCEEHIDPTTHDVILRYYVPVLKPDAMPGIQSYSWNELEALK